MNGLSTPIEQATQRWSCYWQDDLDLRIGIPPTLSSIQKQYGIPKRSIGELLSQINVIQLYTNEFDLRNWFLTSTIEGHQFDQAFIAAADLLKELRYDRPPGSQFEGAYITDHKAQCDTPIVFDTGCSFSVTPFIDDFVTGIRKTRVNDLAGIKETVMVHGVGWVEWCIRDVFGKVAVIRTQAYYVPDANIRLHSPQTYFNENKAGRCILDWRKLEFETADGDHLVFPYNPQSNIPLMFLDHEICQAGFTAYQIYHLSDDQNLNDDITSLLQIENHNLSTSEKELLLWHQRLGHAGFGWVQDLMYKLKNEIGEDSNPPLLPTKLQGTKRCNPPLCAACQFGKQHRKTPDSSTTHSNPEREMAIRKENLNPGDCISIDQYVCKVPGRVVKTYGREHTSTKYNGGTVYIDHSSAYVYLKNQVSLRVGETLQGKHEFENLAAEHGIRFKSFHADNQPFASKEFLEDLELQDQTITYSGVGAHHANGVAERTLKTVTTWARALMMHQLMHWPGEFSADLWPFAMNHAVHLWNSIPRSRNGLTPYELLTQTKQPNHDILKRTRVWGCPVYVLDPTLQDGKKLPKWKKRARLGMYVGNSPQHHNTVGLILNLDTRYVSPQYHVVYDERFTTVAGRLTRDVFDANEWNELLSLDCIENHLDPQDVRDNHVPYQEFYDEFAASTDPDAEPISPFPRGDVSDNGSDMGSVDTIDDDAIVEFDNSPTVRTVKRKPKSKPKPKLGRATEGVRTRTRTRPRASRNQNPQYEVGTYRGYKRRQHLKFAQHIHDRYQAGGNPSAKIRAGTLESSFIQGLEWSTALTALRSTDTKRVMLSMLRYYDHDNETMEDWCPMALAAKANDADTPNWNQAMNGPFAEGFWEACHKEIMTLIKMGVWEVVDREAWMQVIPTTFAFRIKRLPSGVIRKLKARFCVRGDMEIENVHYWETFAPVVSWNTVRLLLILAAQLDLATRQVDYTAAFVHADVETPPNYENMTEEEQYRSSQFAEMPRGFAEPGKVLRLMRNLYGKKSAPRLWFQHLKERLISCGFKQMIDVDPCLFISDKVICLVYVDDTLLYARNMKDIDDVIERLTKEHRMTLEVEDDVAGFLGVHINKNRETGEVTLTQRGLIDRIIEAMHIEDLPAVATPATECLGKDPLGDPATTSFSFSSVIGMLWYLYGHSRPDLGFAVSQAARFAFAPKRSHELALIRIGQYLKGTRDKGLILKPMATDHFEMDAYVDSDFMGLYGKEARTDPANVKSRGGHIILVNGCPIVWQSKLIDAVCLSTMMAEYYALSIAMREVLPLRSLVQTVAEGLKINTQVQTDFKVTIWEDNNGCLTLANLDPGQTTARSKFYDSKVHWFRSHLSPLSGSNSDSVSSGSDSDPPPNPSSVPSGPSSDPSPRPPERPQSNEQRGGIWVKKIATSEQLADLFTKPLSREVFERLRKMMMGW